MNYSNRSLLLLALVVFLILAGNLPVYGQGDPGLERAMEVQDRNTPALLNIPDVVGTAVTIAPDGQAAVVIMTRRGGVPGLPVQLEGIPVIVQVTGEIVALRPDGQSTTARWPRPVPIGVSTGHPDITAGTIGARVTNGSQVFALSNNHIYADVNAASNGDAVIQPGTYDGGTSPADDIGTLAAFEPIRFDGSNNTMDAAIALTSTADVGTSTPEGQGYGTPNSTTVPATVGLSVQKYGRTTGHTFGNVDLLNATVNVCYFNPCQKPGNTARFVDQIVITPGTFSAGGDSGSLIVNMANNPVALLFAGSSTHTIASPIDVVLTRFGVTIDSSTAPPPNNSPTVSISSPANGATFTEGDTIFFAGTASDSQDGNLTASLVWTSSLDGQIGTGDSFLRTLNAGAHTITASVTDSGGLTGSASITISVQAAPPPSGITVTSINPNSVQSANTTVPATITGSGFVTGANVTFEGGEGPAPTSSNVVVSADSATITLDIVMKSGGPPRNRLWDVRVTNPDGSSAVLVDGFTVTL